MSFFYATLGALAILAGFLFAVGRQNQDLLRVRAYGALLVRLLPPPSAGAPTPRPPPATRAAPALPALPGARSPPPSARRPPPRAAVRREPADPGKRVPRPPRLPR